MKIIVRKAQQSVNKGSSTQSSYMDGAFGFWGEVSAVDSTTNRVRVVASTGIEYYGLPVASNEWVNKTDNYVSGEIKLPPIGSRVFVLTPTGTIAGAFVLCSGYAAGDPSTHELYSNKNEKEKNNKIAKKRTQSGWLETEEYESGIRTFISQNKKMQIQLNPDEKENSIDIKLNDFEIKIDENGLHINNSGSSQITMKSDNDLIIDAGSNKTEIITSKFTVGKTKGNPSLEVG